MPRPRIYKTEAIVLRQQPLGEADRIVTLIAPAAGKIRAVARGVRRPKSKLGGHLELLNRVVISVAEGRSLDHVSEVDTLDSHLLLRDDLERLATAMYLAEIVDTFSVENSPAHDLYDLFAASLTHLESTESQQPLLRYFELGLLNASGFQPELYQCIHCREELQPTDHVFSPQDSGVFCSSCRSGATRALLPLSVGAMKVLRFLDREPMSRALTLNVSDGVWLDVERILRAYLRHVAERDIRSADFMSLVASRTRTDQAGQG